MLSDTILSPSAVKSQPNGHANSNDYLYQGRPFVRILLLLWKYCLGFGVISAWEEWMG